VPRFVADNQAVSHGADYDTNQPVMVAHIGMLFMMNPVVDVILRARI